MPHFQDQETLARILGTEVIPNSVLEECDLRTSMFHRSGGSGPIGALALISMVRELGLKPATLVERERKTEWRNMPSDGSVRVEAGPFFGSMQPGTYLGLADHGMLAIRLDEDAFVREMRADMVRLAADQRKPVEGSEDADKPDARINLIKPPVRDVEEAPLDFTEDPDLEEGSSVEGFDWASYPSNAPVWVAIENADPVDAVFKRKAKNGKIEIVIPGQRGSKYVEASTVKPAQ